MSDITPLEDVAKGVHDLTEAVTEMRAGLVDETKVRAIAEDVLQAQRAAAVEQKRSGFNPAEIEETGEVREQLRAANPQQRLAQIHQRSAHQVAPLVRASKDAIEEFQRRSDELLLISTIAGIAPRETQYFAEQYVPALRAVDTQTTSEGKEFVPRELSANLIERINLPLMVAALFPNVAMPSNPFDIPGKSVSRQRLGNLAEQTADTGQSKVKAVTPGTRVVTLTAKPFNGEAITSRDLDEDSIIAIMPFLLEELTDYMAADIEDALLNGDSAGSQDTGFAAAGSEPRRNFDGLRKQTAAGAKTDAGNTPLSLAHLRANRKAMGKYGVRVSDLVHILSINAYISLLSDANVQTIDKYGPNATVLAGELAKVDGVPVVVSEYARTDLNATGVFDNTTTTRTSALTVHRSGFAMGERRGLTVQVLRELYAESDQDAVVVTARKAFARRFPSSEPVVAQAYNVAS
jgi:HK97 family phage major capsid protein